MLQRDSAQTKVTGQGSVGAYVCGRSASGVWGEDIISRFMRGCLESVSVFNKPLWTLRACGGRASSPTLAMSPGKFVHKSHLVVT